MDKKSAAKWIKALRSGKYKQTTKTLCKTIPNTKEIGYCCLGVLCEVVGAERVKYKGDYSFTGIGNQATLLSKQMQNKVGMKTNDGKVGKYSSLADKNDNGKTFEEIADFIENHVDEL